MDLATAAAELDLPCFPCNAQKQPVVSRGFKTASRQLDAIRRSFAIPGAAMIGVPTGSISGIVAVDVDVREQHDGRDWLDMHASVLPETRTHRTRSGGLHLLFRCPEGVEIRNSAGRVAPGIDVRGEGGYVIFPPSPGYVVADPAEPAEMPSWLIAACSRPEPEAPPEYEPRPQRDVGGTRYGLKALDAECEAIRTAPFGQQENTLNSAALKIGRLVAGSEIEAGLALSDLLASARSIASEPGKPAWSQAELEQKVRRAFADGQRQPRQAPPRPEQQRQAKREKRAPDPDRDTGSDASQEPPRDGQEDDPAGVGLTEDEIALSFAQTHQGRAVYDHTDVNWYCWADDRWKRDDTNLAFDLVRKHVRAIREAQAEPPRTLAKIAFSMSVERAARADRRIAVAQFEWDRNSWVLGVPGGVVNLKTGKVRPGNPAEFISRQTSVAPAPEGTAAPLWTAFLKDATRDDADVMAFLQRLAGYILTGEVSEEVLCFLYGSGGNGKGVFIGTLVSILNDYAVAVPIDAFTASSRLNGEYYRAQMAGARLVTASETEAGATWAESQIKELTGNEAPLSARNPHGRPFTYRPQFKLAIVGNHAPRLKGRSPAMERRLRIVPFTHAPLHPDPNLKDKLRAEYPAILRWMIDGCLEWQQFRLGTAPAIAAATSDYFEQQDGFRRWLDERCILDDTPQSRPGALFADFKAWCTANGEDAPNANEFAELLDRTPGIKRFRTHGSRWVRGIGLKVERRGADKGAGGADPGADP